MRNVQIWTETPIDDVNTGDTVRTSAGRGEVLDIRELPAHRVFTIKTAHADPREFKTARTDLPMNVWK